MMEEKRVLKNCPFCGDKPKIINYVGEFWVKCANCLISTRFSSNENEAMKSWNTRSQPVNALVPLDYSKVWKKAKEYLCWGYYDDINEINKNALQALLIHICKTFGTPERKELKIGWPEKKLLDGQRIDVRVEFRIWNDAIEACEKAFAEAQQRSKDE